jgi:hypothetical protein
MMNDIANASLFNQRKQVGRETWIDKIKKGNKLASDPKIRSIATNIKTDADNSRISILNQTMDDARTYRVNKNSMFTNSAIGMTPALNNNSGVTLLGSTH